MAKVGFSGSRYGMSSYQKEIVADMLSSMLGEFHHGDCVGADEEAHTIAHELGYSIFVHPPLDNKLQAYVKNYTHIYPPMPYKARNKFIVQRTDSLIACPASKNQRGGTWNAIEWAMGHKGIKRPITIIHKDGGVVKFNFDS